jgi:hypothetical protein
MSPKKKDSEDDMVIFKHEQGQTKDDSWLYFATKVNGWSITFNPDQTRDVHRRGSDTLHHKRS